MPNKEIISQEELDARWAKKREQIELLSNSIRSFRNNVTRDLQAEDERIWLTALAVDLMDKTAERVGNSQSARNGHYGITGLKKSHISTDGNRITLTYTGKSGVDHVKVFSDERLAKNLRRAIKNSPNKYLFCTSDRFRIKADKVNRFMEEFGLRSKDIRGYSANRLMINKLKKAEPFETEKERQRYFNTSAKIVAKKIGHGVATLKNQYLLPELEVEYVENNHIVDMDNATKYAQGGVVADKITPEEYAEHTLLSTTNPKRISAAKKILGGVVVGKELRKIFSKLKNRDGNDYVEFSEQNIPTDASYVLVELGIDDLLKKNEDVADYVKSELKRYKAGKKIETPILIGDSEMNGKGGVADGYGRITQTIANGEKTIMAYVDISSPLAFVKEYLKKYPTYNTPEEDSGMENDCAVVSSRFINFLKEKGVADEYALIAGETVIRPAMHHVALLHIPTDMIVDLTYGQFEEGTQYKIYPRKEFEEKFNTIDFDFDGYKSIYGAGLNFERLGFENPFDDSFDYCNRSKKFLKGGNVYRSIGIEGNLVGKSRNPYIGKEEELKCAQNIRCFYSEFSYRFIYVIGTKNVSVLQFDKDGDKWILMNAYTKPAYRRKGYGDKLYKEAQKKLEKITFSKNLSADGEGFKLAMYKKYHKDGGVVDSSELRFYHSCVHYPDVSELDTIVDNEEEIKYEEFVVNVNEADRLLLERKLGYTNDYSITMDNHVRFKKSKDKKGSPVYFIYHSAIEFIFSKKGKGVEPSYKPFEKGGAIKLLAPNGKPSNLSAEQYELVRSPEFKAWFGDWEKSPKKASKALDSNGEPLVVYHGSPSVFDIFNMDNIGRQGTTEGHGFYFTPNKDIAEGYSLRRGQGKLFSVFLNMKNLFSNEKRTITKQQVRNILLELHKKDGEYALSNYGDIQHEGLRKTLDTATEIEHSGSDSDTNFIGSLVNGGVGTVENVLEAVYIVTGKNGAITSWKGEDFETAIYVVTNPTQIKLADGTNKTFDSKNPDVRFEKGGSVREKFKLGGLFHGSNKRFDKFSAENIGDSGDSVGGWGIYATTSREVAGQYLLSSGALYNVVIYEDGEWLDLDNSIEYSLGDKILKGLHRIKISESDIEQFKKDFLALGDDGYEVANGKQVYDYLSAVTGSEKNASLFLLSIGVIGNRFKDKMMPDETNYVVFDADAISISNDSEDFVEYEDGGQVKGRTYNGLRVPESIRTSRIISAFANHIDQEKVDKYTDIMREMMLSHDFPPIKGYPIIISEEDLGDYFLVGEEITKEHIGQMAWKVTDGHHRTLAAIEAHVPVMETELDYSTITNEKDLYEKGGVVKVLSAPLIVVEPVIKGILTELKDAGHECLIVGGAVRDAIIGKRPKDIDIEVHSIGYEKLNEYLSKYGTVNLIGKSFGVIKFNPKGGSDIDYDFSVPRRENKMGVGHKDFSVIFDTTMTIRDAALRRDFTFNALAYNPLTNTIYDYFGGVDDIKNKIIRHTSEQFSEDSLRILRAMQFQARFDFEIHPDTIAEMRQMLSETNDYSELPKERLFEEWKKWAEKGVNHGGIFKFMRDTGLIEYYPSLKKLKETPQDAVYHPEGDVEIHTELCLRHMDKVLKRENITGQDKLILVMAILFHDIAKPDTTEEKMKRGRMTITSEGHEAMGGIMSKDILAGIGFHIDLINPIANLVSNHLAGVNISVIPTESGKIKAVKKLSRRLYPATIHQLLYIMESDHNGRGRAEFSEATGAADLLRISTEIDVNKKPYEYILMGRHLIEAGLKPSPQFGDILRESQEAQENGEFNDVAGAKEWLSRNINGAEQGGVIFEYGGQVLTQLKKTKFSDMPRSYQIGVVIRAYEVNEDIEWSVTPANIDWIKDVSVVDKLIADYSAHYPDRVLSYGLIPTEKIIDKVSENEVVKDYKGGFMECHEAYASTNPAKHSQADIPLLVSSDEDEFIEDGWHRFHRYIDMGVKEMPVVVYSAEEYFEKGGSIGEDDKRQIYDRWNKLVNMSVSQLAKFYASEEGKEAGLTKDKAKELGIRSGRESAKWIMKMKGLDYKKWTPTMWEWANRQISFISRMRGNRGSLYDDKGEKTRKHTSLLIWGHNPEKYASGGKLKKGKGNCFQVAASLLLNNDWQREPITFIGTPYVVHAEVSGQGKLEGIRFAHGWVEDDVFVYDNSNGNNIITFKQRYYEVGKVKTKNPKKYRRYNLEQLSEKLLSANNYGHWDLDCKYEQGGAVAAEFQYGGDIKEVKNFQAFTPENIEKQTLSIDLVNIAEKHHIGLGVIEKQFIKGLEVEKEHTDNLLIAAEIVKDHLVEMYNYYDILEKMERIGSSANKDCDCYKAVQDYLLTSKLPNAIIVHGEVNRIGKIAKHAWIENDNTIIDVVAGVRIPKARYFEILKPKEYSRYTFPEALKLRFKTGGYGAWTKEEEKRILGEIKMFRNGGKVTVGNSYEEWAIEQYLPKDENNAGQLKLVNQQTREVAYILSGKESFDSMWWIKFKNDSGEKIEVAGEDLNEVIDNFVKLKSRKMENSIGSRQVYFGIYNKESELLGVVESMQSDSEKMKYIDGLHDGGYVVKKITKKEYDEYDEGDELTLEDLKNKNYTTMKSGGKLGVGNKYGDWAITQYVPKTYNDLGSIDGGEIKLVNQETMETAYILNDRALRGDMWWVSVDGVRIEDKSPVIVIGKFVALKSKKMENGGAVNKQAELEQIKINLKQKKQARLKKELADAQYKGDAGKIEAILKELSGLDTALGLSPSNQVSPPQDNAVIEWLKKHHSPYGVDRVVSSYLRNGRTEEWQRDLEIVWGNPNYDTNVKFIKGVDEFIDEQNEMVQNTVNELQKWVDTGGEDMKKNLKYKEQEQRIAGHQYLIGVANNIKTLFSEGEIMKNGGRVKMIKEADIQVGKKFELANGELIEIKRLFKENIDQDWVEFTRNGQTNESSVNSLKIFINNWRKDVMEYGGSVSDTTGIVVGDGWEKQKEWHGNPALGYDSYKKIFKVPSSGRRVPVFVFGKEGKGKNTPIWSEENNPDGSRKLSGETFDAPDWSYVVSAGANSDLSHSGGFYPQTPTLLEALAIVDEKYKSGRLFGDINVKQEAAIKGLRDSLDATDYRVLNTSSIGTTVEFSGSNWKFRYNIDRNGGSRKTFKDGGLLVGNSHADGGIPMIVEGSGQHVEVEGKEFVVCQSAFKNDEVIEMEGTRAEIALALNEKYKCNTGVADSLKSGQYILCKKAMADTEVLKLKGTAKEIMTEVAESVSCNGYYEDGGAFKALGGYVSQVNYNIMDIAKMHGVSAEEIKKQFVLGSKKETDENSLRKQDTIKRNLIADKDYYSDNKKEHPKASLLRAQLSVYARNKNQIVREKLWERIQALKQEIESSKFAEQLEQGGKLRRKKKVYSQRLPRVVSETTANSLKKYLQSKGYNSTDFKIKEQEILFYRIPDVQDQSKISNYIKNSVI